MKHLRVIGLLLTMTCNTAAGEPNTTIIGYSDMCDASAAAAISAEMFIVASDENKVLCLKNCMKVDRRAPRLWSNVSDPSLGRATTL